MKKAFILIFLAIPLTGHTQRYAHVRFDSAALAVSISNHEEYVRRDSIRRALLSVDDVSANWTRYGDAGWTEHRDPQPNGTIFLYWTNEDPVYEHGKLTGEFWGLAIPDSVNYRTVRWFWDTVDEHPNDVTAWYASVHP